MRALPLEILAGRAFFVGQLEEKDDDDDRFI